MMSSTNRTLSSTSMQNAPSKEILLRSATILASTEMYKNEIAAARKAMSTISKPVPELHILGEICGGNGFGSGESVSCKFAIEAGDKWELLEGTEFGQTQTDTPNSELDTVVWSHPIDVHYTVGSLQGWPRLLFQVWKLDDIGRLDVEGYGFLHIPTTPGMHELKCSLWRPLGTDADELAAFFVGGKPTLSNTSILFSTANERYRLRSAPSGNVFCRLDLIFRYLDLHAIDT